jgi:hypothetical protein
MEFVALGGAVVRHQHPRTVDGGNAVLLLLWNKYKVYCYRAALRTESDVAYESKAEPIRLGYLFDFRLPPGYLQEMREDLTRPFELVFREGLEHRSKP